MYLILVDYFLKFNNITLIHDAQKSQLIKKILDSNGPVKETYYNAKITELEGRILLSYLLLQIEESSPYISIHVSLNFSKTSASNNVSH